MDARRWPHALLVWGALVLTTYHAAQAASYRTTNFIVQAPTAEIAAAVGDSAEGFRRDLAVEWLGKPMPAWAQPCPIQVDIGQQLGAGGATSFVFDRGEVFGWQMNIQGPLDRVLDSVLPHEVTHTIFASHFRRPLPRWADEGCCTTVEHDSERGKQQRMLIAFLKTGRGIPFGNMFAMREYPRDILPLYAQGHSLATFLLSQGGKAKFLQFLHDGMETDEWSATLDRHYGFRTLDQLQTVWLDWVRQGSPALAPRANQTLVAANAPGPAGDVIYRAQSADDVKAAATSAAAPGPHPTERVVPITRNGAPSATPAGDGWRRAPQARSAANSQPASPQPPVHLSAALPLAPPEEASPLTPPPASQRRVLLEWSANTLDASRDVLRR